QVDGAAASPGDHGEKGEIIWPADLLWSFPTQVTDASTVDARRDVTSAPASALCLPVSGIGEREQFVSSDGHAARASQGSDQGDGDGRAGTEPELVAAVLVGGAVY